jgi:hypothetical protein
MFWDPIKMQNMLFEHPVVFTFLQAWVLGASVFQAKKNIPAWESRFAFLMGTHTRLGRESLAGKLDKICMSIILVNVK